MSARSAAALKAEREQRFTALDFGLYAIVVLAWGTSWIAVKHQVGSVAPEISVFWRFLLASLACFAIAAVREERLRFGPAHHLLFAALGLLMFSVSFLLFYYGAKTLPSGLLSVVFSLASVVSLVLGAAVRRVPPPPRMALGALLGASGVALLFWPQFSEASLGGPALAGLLLCIAGTVCFCVGNLLSGIQLWRETPVVAGTAWGMLYGVGAMGLLAWTQGLSFEIDWRGPYLVSLLVLAIWSSVIAFLAYMTLLVRIGPARASYATVMFPLVALAISTVAEGYVWTLPAVLGVICALAGNLLVLTPSSPHSA